MTVAGDLVLITTDPLSGRSLLGSTETDPVVGGALLVDLVLAERCEVVGPPKRARVRVLTTTPLGSAVHDRALAGLRPGHDARAATVVPRLGKGARRRVLDQLAAEEAVAPRREKVLGVFSRTRYDVVDIARRDAVLAPVLAVLLGRAEPDEATGPLVGLLSSGGAVSKLVAGPDRRAAVRRAKDVARGEWAGAVTNAAVTAANAAVTAAVTAAVVAAAAGGAAGGS
ncbi:GPP34 family phosphoprotein [Nocardioides carbamazepini]|uniref:GOLPH3/VPS74 family protein n=1 Tax=Nocardioides carbamazepini TaxID=2854259 RepID=UPI00214A44D4|nr:GPP34 family phosphoprotein [Nocardioides carbamazepini]MCR1783354.1 GPP34 family phosphoprotein [Nocardioides carbamazepini]